MKDKSWVWFLLGLGIFVFQEMGEACGVLPRIDLFLPLILWRVYWASLDVSLLVFAAFWGLVVDSFSSLIPGPALISYLVAVFVLHYLKWRFSPWVAPTRMLSFALAFLGAEVLRLYVLPVVLDLPLPRDIFRLGLEMVAEALFWSLVLEALSQTAVARRFFAPK